MRAMRGVLAQTRNSHWPHEDSVQKWLGTQQASRYASVLRLRLREARFPDVTTLDTFDSAPADA